MIWMKINNKDELINTRNVNDMGKNHILWMPLKKHIMCMILTTYTQVTFERHFDDINETSFMNEKNYYLYVLYGNVDEI